MNPRAELRWVYIAVAFVCILATAALMSWPRLLWQQHNRDTRALFVTGAEIGWTEAMVRAQLGSPVEVARDAATLGVLVRGYEPKPQIPIHGVVHCYKSAAQMLLVYYDAPGGHVYATAILET